MANGQQQIIKAWLNLVPSQQSSKYFDTEFQKRERSILASLGAEFVELLNMIALA